MDRNADIIFKHIAIDVEIKKILAVAGSNLKALTSQEL